MEEQEKYGYDEYVQSYRDEYQRAPLSKKIQMRVLWFVLRVFEGPTIDKPWEGK